MFVYVVEDMTEESPEIRQVFQSHYAATRYVKQLKGHPTITPYPVLKDIGVLTTRRTLTVQGDSRHADRPPKCQFRTLQVVLETYPQLKVQSVDEGVQVTVSVFTPKPRADFWWTSRYMAIMQVLVDQAAQDLRGGIALEALPPRLKRHLTLLERTYLVDTPRAK